MLAKSVETVVENGAEVFIPLNKLKKRRSYAAGIAAKGILQNLAIEPELDGDGSATGFYFVTIGEGRRLAQLLRVKRKEIKKTEPIQAPEHAVRRRSA
jgi:ParB family transcriptional regulator, chromosome partitioning protein